MFLFGVFFPYQILNSHGNCHSTLPPLPRVDGAPLPAFCPDPLHDEWYFHMPYGCPPADQGLYDFVGYQGYYADMKEDDVPRTHTSLLYAQMLFYAFHRMLEQAPCRTIVPLVSMLESMICEDATTVANTSILLSISSVCPGAVHAFLNSSPTIGRTWTW